MSTKLQYGKFNDFGRTTIAGDLSKSGKWNYAAQKLGLQEGQVDSLFDYWQNSSFMKGSRYAQGLQGRGKVGETSMQGPLGGGRTSTTFLDYAKKTQDNFNAFEGLQAKALQKNKLDFSVDEKTGVATYYDKKMEKQWQLGGPLGGSGTTNKEPVRIGPNGVPIQDSRSLANQGKWVQKEGRGQKYTGRMLNDTFVEQSAYDKMSETDRKFYGLSSEQAYELDPSLKAASQVVGAAHQYRQGRSRKKTGVGAVVGTLAKTALPAFGALALGPVGGAIGGAVSSGIQSGNLGDAALGGLKGYIGGQGAQLVGGAGGGSPYSDGGALGGAIQGTTNGANSMGFLDELFKGGSDLIGNLGDGIGDIFKGGTGGLTDFLSGGGKAGQLGGLLNKATGGQSGGIGNILSGIAGGNLGQILSGGGQLGLLDGLLGSGQGGATPGFSPISGGGAPAGGGGTYQTVGGQAPQQGGQPGGQLGGLLGLLASGFLSQHSTGEVRDEIKSGRDRAISLADPLANQRSTFAGQLGALMADPSQRVPELPGYQFRFNQGQKAMQRAADAGGLAGSGNALIAAAEYGQNFAQAAYDSEFKKLYDLSSGSTAASQAASNAGTQLALLEHGKYADYAGLINQGTGGAIPNPGGNLVLPGQGQQQGYGGMLEQIITRLLGDVSGNGTGNLPPILPPAPTGGYQGGGTGSIWDANANVPNPFATAGMH